ncbi:MAG: fused MFS/spermidine synthase [Xanthobacteraceae bacterium]|nr:fused MFS/spermidine synthase [Xanthobacteraceae bacterium]
MSAKKTPKKKAAEALPLGVLLPLFMLAIFVSAALLFFVQPMFAKMVLPRLGGTPAVWSVAMVFFQTVLLAGYAYAHFLTKHLQGRQAVMIHIAVMLAAILFLPLSIASGWNKAPAWGEAFWLLGLFTVSIGLPFFALSANGPLLQAWFARTDHPAAKDPYFLYAASNIGSFLALLAYPFAVEPLTRLQQQTFGWSAGFIFLIVLIAACGYLIWHTKDLKAAKPLKGESADKPTWAEAAVWIALAAIPSGLLIAVTNHISTDVAAVPFLWVVPLALYLLTFVLVFSRFAPYVHQVAVIVQPLFIAALIASQVFEGFDSIFWILTIHIAAFFFTALVCHGELARLRPAPAHLTEFYMWMSAGGMIGGIAAALVAPQLFNWVAEYPILIVLALLCRPGWVWPDGRYAPIFWIVLALAAAAALAPAFGYRVPLLSDLAPGNYTYMKWVIGFLLVASILISFDSVKYAYLIALCFLMIKAYENIDSRTRATLRSFFGVHKVTDSYDGRFRVLLHGTTIHGAQRMMTNDFKPYSGRPELTTYYYKSAAIAQAVAQTRLNKNGPINYAVVGLGTGTLACHKQEKDTVHYYEIDPTTIEIATNPKRYGFSFLAQCAPDAKITLGDARLTIAEAPDGSYDFIVIDAFSSDAIPIHLMTKEAVETYKKKLAPRGILVMHISNRHLELASVVAGIANANGMVVRTHNTTDGDDEVNDEDYKFSGTVTAIVRKPEDFGALNEAKHWKDEKVDPAQWVWTDDYSNVLGAMIRHSRGY